MRKMITLTAIAAAVAFATTAGAQQQPAPASPTAPAQAAPSPASPTAPATSAPALQSVSIVELDQLPQDTQKKVNDMVAEGGEAGLKQLRESIEATPQITTALKDKGLTSTNVIVASLSQDGVLTLVTTKKAS